MRKIILTNFERPVKSSHLTKQRLYNIYLNDKRKYYTNEKELVKFLVETNRLLNDTFMNLNKYNSDLYVIYRQVYFYFDFYTAEENKIHIAFSSAEEIFKRLIRNTTGPNGNTFAFNFMKAAIYQHQTICNILDKFLVDIREDSLRNNVKMINENLNRLQIIIDNYPG